MNLKTRLTKIVDATASHALASVIHDIPKFQEMVQDTVDTNYDLLTQHYTVEKVMEQIHAIDDIRTLSEFKVIVVPKEAMAKVAAHIDKHYSKEPVYVQVQIYLESMQQLHKGGGDYLKECLRQRMQTLAQLQSNRAGKIILPDNQIIS